jgi:xanthine dehydrogenase iron-sulfur cluster and FAD-binding subunit A
MGEIFEIRFKLNGTPISVRLDQPSKLLIDYLHDLKLFGTKYGCGEGGCGSCTVMMRRSGNDFVP